MVDYGKEQRIAIANRLKRLREEENLTQEELANKIGISKPTIVSWERQSGDNKIPNMNQLITLAGFYDCSVGYLLCEYDSLEYEDGNVEKQLCVSAEALKVLKPSWYTVPAEDIFKNDKEQRKEVYQNETLSYLIANSETIVTDINNLKRMQNQIEDFRRDPEHRKYETIFTRVDLYWEFFEIEHGDGFVFHDSRRDTFIEEMKKVVEKDGVGERPCTLISLKEYGRLFDILKGYERNALMYSISEKFNELVRDYVDERWDDNGEHEEK